jgi:phage terminase large subunit
MDKVEKWNKQTVIDGFQVMVGCHPEVENIHSTYLLATKYLSHSFLKKAWKWRTRAKMGRCPIEDRELTDDEITKAKKWYLSNYLGGWRDRSEGAIYDNWEIGEFNTSLPYVYGLDFGSNDPDAITKVAVDENKKRIYIKEIYFKNNTSVGQLMKILHDRVGTIDLIIADAAERRLINDYYNGMYGPDGEWLSGVNIRKVRKSKGIKLNFVARRLKTLQGYTLVITPESTNVIKAVKNYAWHDSRSGVPKHEWSDLCDSFGYAAIDLIEY